MKKSIFIFFCICIAVVSVWAQDEEKKEEKEGGFQKENLFTGGSVTLSFFNGQTVLGANPVFGYRLSDWADAGLAFNFVYNGSRDYYEFDDKMKQTLFGPGVFARLYPVRFLFVQGQFEHNFITQKYIPSAGSVTYIRDKKKMYDLCDAAIILPGGFGTLDELFEMVTWNQLSIHDKMIYILNSGGFYNHLIAHIRQMQEESFLYEEAQKRIIIINTPDELIDHL